MAANGRSRRLAGPLLTVLAFAAAAQTPPRPPAPIDAELLLDLQGWATRLSGMAAPAQWPGLQPLPTAALAAQVCPDRPSACQTLIAVYDTDRQRILYRDSLNLADPTDQSFLVHELVHHLQHRRDGDALFSTCERALAAESEAYAVQNRYLAHFRQWRRAGEMLRFTHCSSASAEPQYTPGAAALTSRSPQGR